MKKSTLSYTGDLQKVIRIQQITEKESRCSSGVEEHPHIRIIRK